MIQRHNYGPDITCDAVMNSVNRCEEFWCPTSPDEISGEFDVSVDVVWLMLWSLHQEGHIEWSFYRGMKRIRPNYPEPRT